MTQYALTSKYMCEQLGGVSKETLRLWKNQYLKEGKHYIQMNVTLTLYTQSALNLLKRIKGI